MYCVINHIPVDPDHHQDFEDRFRASLVHMEGVDGFVRVDVWRPAPAGPPGGEPPVTYMVQTVWASEAAFRAWIGSDSFRASHKDPMPDAWRAGSARMTAHTLAFDRKG